MDASWTFCLLLIFLLECLHKGVSIKCWVCRSDYDRSCADPFDNTTIPITNCDEKLSSSFVTGVTICRKIQQTVNGELKIFRDCAYSNDLDIGRNGTHCVMRIQTRMISTEYCTCNDEDGCNVF